MVDVWVSIVMETFEISERSFNIISFNLLYRFHECNIF